MNKKKIFLKIIMIVIIFLGIVLIKQVYDYKERNKNSEGSEKKIYPNQLEISNNTQYDKVEIEFLSDMLGFKQLDKFTTKDLKLIESIDSKLTTVLISTKEDDFNNNHTYKYKLKLSNDIGGYSCILYYDTLYDKAYIEKDSDLFEVETDFARYVDSLLENTNIDTNIDDVEALELFDKYAWTLNYRISSKRYELGNIKNLGVFNPKEYYFAYNNELSKDIGLDFSIHPKDIYIDVDIYRIYESMPEEFFPIKDARGIVVKNNGKIIGSFISSGRHSTFNACSLKGNSFEKVIGQTVDEWLNKMIIADSFEKDLSKLHPSKVIERYFTSLDKKDANAAIYYISKRSMLENLTLNMLNNELFNDNISLALTDTDINDIDSFANLKSAKLLETNLINDIDSNNKVFRVNVDLQYKKEFTINNGAQVWDCHMLYESPQTGWKNRWLWSLSSDKLKYKYLCYY